MLVSSHLEKIRRLEKVRHQLDPMQDFELWFWSTMLAGTNALNAVLHHADVTPQESAFPSQPGVYQVRCGSSYAPAYRKNGDLLHVGRPPLEGPVPEDVRAMMGAMERIEAYRDPCTRGEMQVTPEIVGSCNRDYAKCLTLLWQRVSQLRDASA